MEPESIDGYMIVEFSPGMDVVRSIGSESIILAAGDAVSNLLLYGAHGGVPLTVVEALLRRRLERITQRIDNGGQL
jgi:hypothetical protein